MKCRNRHKTLHRILKKRPVQNDKENTLYFYAYERLFRLHIHCRGIKKLQYSYENLFLITPERGGTHLHSVLSGGVPYDFIVCFKSFFRHFTTRKIFCKVEFTHIFAAHKDARMIAKVLRTICF